MNIMAQRWGPADPLLRTKCFIQKKGSVHSCNSDSVMKDMSLTLRRCALTVLTACSLQSQNSSATPQSLRLFGDPGSSGSDIAPVRRSLRRELLPGLRDSLHRHILNYTV